MVWVARESRVVLGRVVVMAGVGEGRREQPAVCCGCSDSLTALAHCVVGIPLGTTVTMEMLLPGAVLPRGLSPVCVCVLWTCWNDTHTHHSTKTHIQSD